jgi:hypothetical protein
MAMTNASEHLIQAFNRVEYGNGGDQVSYWEQLECEPIAVGQSGKNASNRGAYVRQHSGH